MNPKLTAALETLSDDFDTSPNLFDVLITIYRNNDAKSLSTITSSDFSTFIHNYENLIFELVNLVLGFSDISEKDPSPRTPHDSETAIAMMKNGMSYVSREDKHNFSKDIEESVSAINNFVNLDLSKEANQNNKHAKNFKNEVKIFSEMIGCSEDNVIASLPRAHLIEKELMGFSGLSSYV